MIYQVTIRGARRRYHLVAPGWMQAWRGAAQEFGAARVVCVAPVKEQRRAH